jgi:ABC-type multidrug transport system permease subunit
MTIKHSWMIAISELKQVWNDKRTFVLLVIAPIVLCISFGFVAYRNPEQTHTTVFVEKRADVAVSSEMQNIIHGIDSYTRDDGSKPFSVQTELNSREAALQKLDRGLTRAVIVLKQGDDGQLTGVEAICAVGEPSITSIYEDELPKYFENYAEQLKAQQIAEMAPQTIQFASVQASIPSPQSGFKTVFRTDAWIDQRYFDFFASAIMVIMAIAMPLLLAVVSITSERSKGTFERIFVTPYKKSEYLGGKAVALSVFAILFAFLFIGTLKLVFNVALGNPSLVFLIAVLVGINGAVLGLLVSSVSRSEAESVIIGIMGMIGIMVIMTYWFPWETMHPALVFVSKIIPFTYGIQTIRRVNMLGLGISQVWPNLIVLAGSIVVLILISIPVLKREVK